MFLKRKSLSSWNAPVVYVRAKILLITLQQASTNSHTELAPMFRFIRGSDDEGWCCARIVRREFEVSCQKMERPVQSWNWLEEDLLIEKN